MFENEKIDIKENEIAKLDTSLLQVLLRDNTTKQNIIWATNDYECLGEQYQDKKTININQITGNNGEVIKPRVEKNKKEQQNRVRNKAEVFTPSWIVNMQNNLIDEEWFGRKEIFNVEKDKKWIIIEEKIQFPVDKIWKEYIKSKRLEITCGEAPYLVSRYDTVTGKIIKVKNRVGLLDRKLRIVCENTDSKEDWEEWTRVAYKNIYGYEWQGDNLLLARENLLYTYRDYYEYKFKEKPSIEKQLEIADIISYNIFQMDGLKFVIPNSCVKEKDNQISLFDYMGIQTEKKEEECYGCKKGNYKKHNGIYAKTKDWDLGKMILFKNLIGRGGKPNERGKNK